MESSTFSTQNVSRLLRLLLEARDARIISQVEIRKRHLRIEIFHI